MAFAGSVLQEVLNAGRNPFRRRVTVAQGKHQLCTPKTNRKGPAPGLPPPPPPPPGRSRGSILAHTMAIFARRLCRGAGGAVTGFDCRQTK